jgi:hypothetical protein
MNEHARMEERAAQRQLHIAKASSKLAATSRELATYEAIIAARAPLPAPAEISFLPITSTQRRHLLARGLIYERLSMINYVVFLRGLQRHQKRMLEVKRLVRAWIDIAAARNSVSRARKELDAAYCAKAAAQSTMLPQAMGEGQVGQGLATRLA